MSAAGSDLASSPEVPGCAAASDSEGGPCDACHAAGVLLGLWQQEPTKEVRGDIIHS